MLFAHLLVMLDIKPLPTLYFLCSSDATDPPRKSMYRSLLFSDVLPFMPALNTFAVFPLFLDMYARAFLLTSLVFTCLFNPKCVSACRTICSTR